MLTLTLDGQPVDLPADAAVALSYRSSDLRRLDTREAAFSETFALPLTAQNARVLGTPHALSSLTRSPYRRLPAVLRSNGLPVLTGVAVLEASEMGYEVTLLDDTADLFGRVGDLDLRSLDLSAYDHPRTFTAIQAASTDDPARGYVYALADLGYLSNRATDERILYWEQPASVYALTVLAAIVADAFPGYRLAGSLLNEARFQALVLPAATTGPRLRPAYLDAYNVQATVAQDTPYTWSGFVNQNGGGAAVDIAFPVLELGGAAQFDGVGYLPPVHLSVLTIALRLDIDTGPYSKDLFIEYSHTGATDNVYQKPLTRGFNGLYSVDVVLPAYQQPAGLRLKVRVFNAENRGTVEQVTIVVRKGSSVSYTVAPVALTGAPVHLDASLPDISRADLLKLLANQFNAGYRVDPIAREVRCDLFNELERNRGRAVDWSRKLDYSQRPRLDYRLGSYAQQNTFRYKDAPAAYAPAFGRLTPAQQATQVGQGALAVPDETLPATAESYAGPVVLPLDRALAVGAAVAWLPLYALPGPTPYNPPATYFVGNQVARYGRLWNYAPAATGANNGPGAYYQPGWQVVGEGDAEVPAVALLTPIAPVSLWEELPSSLTYTQELGLTRAGLSFADLLPAYHEGTARILERVQLLTASFTLGAADMAGLDFAVPVRLDIPWVPGYGALQGWFYANLLDQFAPGVAGSTRVELLRLGDPVAGLAPAATPLPARPERLLLNEYGPPLLAENNDYLEEER